MIDDLAALVATATKPLWLRALPYVLLVAALATGAFVMYDTGRAHEHQARLAEVAKLQLQHTTELTSLDTAHRIALQAATDAARATEAKAATDMAALDRKHHKELTDANDKAAADIAALRAGAVRVRESLTCASPAGAGGDGAQAATATGVGDAGTPRGLQAADAEFLLRVGAEADTVAIQLQACQAIVIQDRADASGVSQP